MIARAKPLEKKKPEKRPIGEIDDKSKREGKFRGEIRSVEFRAEIRGWHSIFSLFKCLRRLLKRKAEGVVGRIKVTVEYTFKRS